MVITKLLYRLIENNITENGAYPTLSIPCVSSCSVHWNKVPTPDKYGDFELLIDEELYQSSDHSSR